MGFVTAGVATEGSEEPLEIVDMGTGLRPRHSRHRSDCVRVQFPTDTGGLLWYYPR